MALYERLQVGPIPLGRKKNLDKGDVRMVRQPLDIQSKLRQLIGYEVRIVFIKILSPNELHFQQSGCRQIGDKIEDLNRKRKLVDQEINKAKLTTIKTSYQPRFHRIIWEL